jgi:hypothetical protein
MTLNFSRPLHWNKKFNFVAKKQGDKVMRIEYDTVFIKLLAKEVVKEMRRTEQEKPQPELISSKEAAALIGVSEDYVRKIKDRLPHVKQGNNKQGRLLFVKEGLMEAYLNSK